MEDPISTYITYLIDFDLIDFDFVIDIGHCVMLHFHCDGAAMPCRLQLIPGVHRQAFIGLLFGTSFSKNRLFKVDKSFKLKIYEEMPNDLTTLFAVEGTFLKIL